MIKLSRRKNTIRGGMPREKDIECLEITTLIGHSKEVESVAFHPTMPNLMATGSWDKTAKLWRFRPDGSAEHTPVSTLKGHSGNVNCVTFHPTLPLIATGSGDNIAKLWRFRPDGSAEQTPVATLEGHSGTVRSVTFHPTWPLLATCSADKTMKLWHVKYPGSSVTCMSTLRGHRSGINSLAFHPTLPLLATGSGDKTVKIWILSEVLGYLRRISITRAGLTSRLIQALTTDPISNRASLQLSNQVQGKVGNPPDFPLRPDNSATQSKIKSKKYQEFPRDED